ncbi:unnamed protein product [Owenia fusiformis]|uniref:Uncharacterized protein n=1 Tax=Owenia fusiformis TaxID=6347 RepID=A0A8J1XXE8_OWEFU|nr:unnamed protein product [Owenia fusiformis]
MHNLYLRRVLLTCYNKTHGVVNVQICRSYCDRQPKTDQIQLSRKSPKTERRDQIGPPDVKSNLRHVKFHVPENETASERAFRERMEEIQQWNQDFWENHNNLYRKAKKEYVAAKLDQLGHFHDDGTKRNLSPDEMADFYREFSIENRNKHIRYNKEWYKMNILSLWPALKLATSQIFKAKT